MRKEEKVCVLGAKGMLGSAILRLLTKEGYKDIIAVDIDEIDLRIKESVEHFFKKENPAYVLLAAARVGGIKANQDYPADFLYDNLMIQNNVLYQALQSKVKKVCVLGSSCIYPKECPQPMKEEYLMTGLLEPTNEGYALAKIAGLKLAKYLNFQYGLKSICPMPCNLYGPNDHFDLAKSHVLSALVKRFVDAVDEQKNQITLWGTGVARREFMHVDDLARALLFLMDKLNSSDIINVGWGRDISIKELAELIAQKTGFRGEILWDKSKPDGMLKKCLDISKISSMGFAPQISLSQGLDEMISLYRQKKEEAKKG
ncbi:MAG: GDP-L-fucose synthase [Candidatus Saganbacteria bacterium]|nr:GDP-L-fucose synthase [Candidatus Saganbacteria bacterium]